MIRLEALADALAFYNRAHDPDSAAYKLRNPGLLRATSFAHKKDEFGNRKFSSHLDGYQALLFDLRIKCSGKSAVKLSGEHSLRHLFKVYGHDTLAAKYITKFLHKAVSESINLDTPLSFFLGA